MRKYSLNPLELLPGLWMPKNGFDTPKWRAKNLQSDFIFCLYLIPARLFGVQKNCRHPFREKFNDHM